MSSFVQILLHVPDSAATMTEILEVDSSPAQVNEYALESLLTNVVDGAQAAFARISTGALQASGTGTFTGAATATETMTIAGVTFTASATPDETANQYLVSATVALEAASLARAINLSTTASKLVSATSALGVVTITSVRPGLTSNFIPTVDVNTSNFTFAQALLAGGTDGTEAAINYGLAS